MSVKFELAGHSGLAMVDKLLKKRLESPCDLVIGNFTEPQLGVSQLGWMSRHEDARYRITEIENAKGDISPSTLRTVTMTCRILLLGEKIMATKYEAVEEGIACAIDRKKQVTRRVSRSSTAKRMQSLLQRVAAQPETDSADSKN